VTSPAAATTHPADLEAVLRRSRGGGLLLVNNYTSKTLSDRVRYRDPSSGAERTTPPLRLSERSGLALPLQRVVAEGARVEVASAEIRGMRSGDRSVALEVWSPSDGAGAAIVLALTGRWRAQVAGSPRTLEGRARLELPPGAVRLTLERLG
jgi:hypothetical protein